MNNLEQRFIEFSSEIQDICSHISIRKNEEGLYILAFGLKRLHSIELRKVNELFVVEFWLGVIAEEEEVVEVLSFDRIETAFVATKRWLEKDVDSL
ncbi:MAG: hypothetical protein CTY16_18080 [Methylobacter sp.]|nr:MAG: hypothetical protein CTY16_18080 [Methylobacter sp.]